jgi:catechol 2,3-dioxygenase
MDRSPSIHQEYGLYRGVRPLRIDHCSCFSDDVDASVDFYNAIGFRLTEYTATEETGATWAAWMHRKGGVHDIAFTNGVGPRPHHIAFWVCLSSQYH